MLFIDEVHRIARPAEELLYVAMEDFRVDVVVGKGPGATAIPLEVAPFTLVGATTRSGLLTGPLRDRFGFTAHMEPYSPAELERVLRPLAPGCSASTLRPDGAAEIAGRSRGTPRIANRLLRRVRDYAEVRADGVVDPRGRPRRARASTTSTSSGSTGSTARCSTRWSAGSAAGRSACRRSPWRSARSAETVEEVAEPFLVRSGLVAAHAARPGGDARRVGAPRARAAAGRGPAVDVLPLDLGDAGDPGLAAPTRARPPTAPTP